MISQHIKRLVHIFGCDGRSDGSVLDFDGNKFGFVLAVGVILEPIIEMIAINSPGLINVSGIFDTDGSHFVEHHSFGGHEGNVVLFDQDVAVSDGDVLVLVQYF